MSKINLPELPPEVDTVRALFRGQPDHFEAQDYYYTQEQMRAYAEQAVRQDRAAQVAKINASMASMSMDGVNGGKVQKEYFKAGARRAIRIVNCTIIRENDHGEST